PEARAPRPRARPRRPCRGSGGVRSLPRRRWRDVRRPASPPHGHPVRDRQRPGRGGRSPLQRHPRRPRALPLTAVAVAPASRPRARPTTLAPRVKVWVIVGGSVKFGRGRADLLEAVAETGSLQKAVARFGMSYRSAWGYFQELERAAGFKFFERRPGARRTA